MQELQERACGKAAGRALKVGLFWRARCCLTDGKLMARRCGQAGALLWGRTLHHLGDACLFSKTQTQK